MINPFQMHRPIKELKFSQHKILLFMRFKQNLTYEK